MEFEDGSIGDDADLARSVLLEVTDFKKSYNEDSRARCSSLYSNHLNPFLILLFPSGVSVVTSIRPVLYGSPSEFPYAACTSLTPPGSDMHARMIIGNDALWIRADPVSFSRILWHSKGASLDWRGTYRGVTRNEPESMPSWRRSTARLLTLLSDLLARSERNLVFDTCR